MPRLSRSRSHPKTLRRGFAAATSSLSRVSKRAQRLVAATVDRPKLQALALMLLTWLALATVPEKATGQIVTSENTIWSATLTAGQTSDTLTTGYADGTYTHNAMGSLTNTMFTYAGIRYTVNELVVHDIAGTYQLDFVLDKTWSHTNTALVMGSNAVALSGFIGGAFSTQVIEVPTDWDNNDVIAVKIVGGPDIQSIGLTSQPSGRNHYAVGDTVTATVRFSQPVHITGTPQLTLDFAGNSRTASCAASTARTTIVCSYTVTATDSAKTGIGIAADSLSLNGGTIKEKDAMGTSATLNHNAVGRSSQHKIDHPGPVRNLRAQAGYDKIILWWDEPSYLGTGHGSFLFYYQYQYKEGTGNWGPWTSTGGAGRGKVISGLTNGTSYSFRVRARTWNAIGQQSSEVTGSPAPKFRLGVTSNGFREGSSEGVTATVSITDGYVLDAPQTFDLEWLDATVAGTYYMHDDNPATITLPAGSIHASVVLRAKHTGSPDYAVPIESELVAKYQGSVIGRQPLTLYDNDPEPVLRLSTSTPEVNEGGAITLTLTASAKSSSPTVLRLNIGNPNKRPLTNIPDDVSMFAGLPNMRLAANQLSASYTIQTTDTAAKDGDTTIRFQIRKPLSTAYTNRDINRNWTARGDIVTVTVRDVTPPGTPTIRAISNAANESGDPSRNAKLNIGVVLSKPVGQTVTVDYRTANGGAIAGTDYVAQSGTLTFAPNEVRQDINIEILEDGVADHGERFRVWLENPTGPAVLTQFYWALGTIYDEKPFLTVHDATGTEGTNATIDFPVRLSKAAKRNVTVAYATSNGSATAGQHQDYTATNGTLTFEPGETEKTISVPLLDDARAESNEQLTLTLESPQRANLADPNEAGQIEAIGTIHNAEPLAVSISDATGTEGVDPTIDFVVSLNRPTVRRVTINVLFSSGSADFSDVNPPVPYSVTFEPGETQKTYAVGIVNDSENEPQETFSMVLQSPLPSDVISIADSLGAGTIYNSESLTARFKNLASEHDGATAFTFDVFFSNDISASAATLRDHSFTVTGAEVTDAEQIDNRKDRWRITLEPAGERWATVTLLDGRDCAEAGAICTDEKNPVMLSNSPAATIAGPEASDDTVNTAEPDASIAGGTATEGTDTSIRFTVTLDNAATDTVTIDYATADGTATAGSDYTETSGTLTFAAGTTSQAISVPIADDSENESDETFTVTLSNPTGATLETSSATGTIANRTVTAPPSASISSADTATEGTDASVVFTVTLDRAATATVTIDYATANGTASAGSDYTSTSGTLTFAAGTTTRTITVPIADDAVNESDETFTVTLSNPSGATLGTSSASATITNRYVTPLTASFANVPNEHGGPGEANRFTFDLSFSENLELSYRRLRDHHAFTVDGGQVKQAQRKVQGSNQHWTITVEPEEYGSVSLTLPGGRACTASNAICTSDNRPLSNSPSATVRGPAALAVADASANENTDNALEFPVTLDRASTLTVTVDYATSDGTATAGQDYTATSGILTFSPGETTKTITVPVLNDAIDDGGETVTLTLSNATNARIADGTATGTIENADPLQREWIARFGRTVASDVVDGIAERLENPRGASEVRVAGLSVEPAASAPSQASDATDTAHRPATVHETTLRDAVLASSFALQGGADAKGNSSWGAWGRFSTNSFEGKADTLTLSGDVVTGLLGADVSTESWTAGLALSAAKGDGPYTMDDANQSGCMSGRVDSNLTSLHPYAQMKLNERVSAWAIGGYGTGEMTIDPDGCNRHTTDIDMTMGAVGLRGQVLQIAAGDAVDMAVRTDALWARTTSDRTDELQPAKADVTRVRLMLNAGRAFPAGAGTLTPTLEAGLRHDAGNAEEGIGLEIGASLAYRGPGITLEGKARTLVAHDDKDYDEWGASFAVRVDPGRAGRGLSLSITPAWGSAASEAEQLWSTRAAGDLVADNAFKANRRIGAELGYGVGGPGELGTLTRYAGLSLTNGAERTIKGGLRWNAAESATLGLEAAREERAGDAPARHTLMLRAAIGF